MDPTTTHDTAAETSGADKGPHGATNPTPRLSDQQRTYLRFGAMIAASMVTMFVIMYLNTYELAHVQWSETRLYMTFVMGAAMVVVMLTFMLGMYTNRKVNTAIYLASVAVFAGALWLVRSQATVEDVSYMRAMTPHHSIAILTSERADIEDVRVRELADEIIEAQRREIAEMEWLIDDIQANGVADTPEEAAQRPVPEFRVE
jgi:hypothetical protein